MNLCNEIKEKYLKNLNDVWALSKITATATTLGICTDGTTTDVTLGEGAIVNVRSMQCPKGEKLETIIYGALPVKWQFDYLPQSMKSEYDFILNNKSTMKAWDYAGLFPSKSMIDTAWTQQVDNVCSLNIELKTLSCTKVTFENVEKVKQHYKQFRNFLMKLYALWESK